MTTPDPALDAALDRYAASAWRVGKVHNALTQSTGDARDDLERQYIQFAADERAARAAVVACAAPALARVERLEAVADKARGVADYLSWHPRTACTCANCSGLTDLKAAIKKLDGEPEDAGAEVTDGE